LKRQCDRNVAYGGKQNFNQLEILNFPKVK
jgi:hypothetical protein